MYGHAQYHHIVIRSPQRLNKCSVRHLALLVIVKLRTRRSLILGHQQKVRILTSKCKRVYTMLGKSNAQQSDSQWADLNVRAHEPTNHPPFPLFIHHVGVYNLN